MITIDGHQTEGLSGEQAAQLLRGTGGTEVHVRLARRTDQIPGVAGTPEARPQVLLKVREVLGEGGRNSAGLLGTPEAPKGRTGEENAVMEVKRVEQAPALLLSPEPARAVQTAQSAFPCPSHCSNTSSCPTLLDVQEVSMRRERVQLSPVFYTALENPSSGAKDVGYVRLTQFSNNAADDMKAAIQDLEVWGGCSAARGRREAGRRWGSSRRKGTVCEH